MHRCNPIQLLRSFYKQFTPENVAKAQKLQDEHRESRSTGEGQGSTVDAPIDPSKVPAELEYLIPPPPPTEGEYKAFGQTFLVSQSRHLCTGMELTPLPRSMSHH